MAALASTNPGLSKPNAYSLNSFTIDQSERSERNEQNSRHHQQPIPTPLSSELKWNRAHDEKLGPSLGQESESNEMSSSSSSQDFPTSGAHDSNHFTRHGSTSFNFCAGSGIEGINNGSKDETKMPSNPLDDPECFGVEEESFEVDIDEERERESEREREG